MNLITKLFFILSIGAANIVSAQMTVITELPKAVKESSGLAYYGDLLWTHNDSGNDDVLYGLDTSNGEVVKKLFPKKTYNEDWEDLALSTDGQLYIGDLGNNNFGRKSMVIYTIELSNDATPLAKNTAITFPREYTSSKGKIQFDIEAIVFRKGYFYLFTKTRKNKFEGLTRVFQVKAEPGEQTAVYCGSISLCTDKSTCKITAAAYHRESGKLALLSHKHVWVIDDFDPGQLEVVRSRLIELPKDTQKEGLSFKDSNSLYISEERNKGSQRLYLLRWTD